MTKIAPSLHSKRLDLLFTVLAGIGLLITAVGIGLDLIPGTSPGLSGPQILMIVGGVVITVTGLLLRNASLRQAIFGNLLKNLAISVLLTVITLVMIEMVLGVVNMPTRYPTEIPDTFLTEVSWWTCDEAGCHYVYDEMNKACENKEVSGRRCMVNQQGFHDSQDFVYDDAFDDKLRVLMLGDSFTFGGTAEIGSSFVETVESNLPDAVVWNTGIPGAGTNQAGASFEVYAPVLDPQIAILGFYLNDFEDNMMPHDSYFMGVDDTNYPLSIRQYMIDDNGNVTKLDSQSDLYFRYFQVDPPSSALDRFVGTTRVGSLVLNTGDAIQQMINKSNGIRLGRQIDATREHLITVRDYADDNAIDFFILLIPSREDLTALTPRYLSAVQLFEELGIPYLNPLEDLVADDYAPDPDIHWSTAGHVKVGDMLTDCLIVFEETDDLNNCTRLTIPSS